MGNRQSKSSMSGQYSFKGSQGPTVVGTKKDSLTTNGNGPPPLIYDPPDDENMNEIIDDDVNLTVVLPDGSKKNQTVKPSIPMMDLLVNLAASNKLNPASHSLVVLTGDRWKHIDFKANKTIGLLAGDDKTVSVQIIPKKTEEKFKTKSLEKPFELTCRFTVNLSGKQKKVLRISPKVSLGEVRTIICKEKGFDPSQYVFRLPGSAGESLTDETLVGDFKTNEIDFISVAMMQAAATKSMPELAQATTKALSQSNRKAEEGYMPSAGEKKAKRGFLSILGKKDKKFKPNTDPGAENKRKTQSFNVHNRETEQQMRAKSMYVTSGDSEPIDFRRTTGNLHTVSNTQTADFRKSLDSNLTPVIENISVEVKNEVQESVPDTSQTLPKRKKRAAPPPPQQRQNTPQTVQVEIEVKPMEEAEESRIEEISEVRAPLKKLHSRNSSDSSGYHELTLSGAESPEGAKVDNLQTTLDATSIDSAEHFNGDSGIRDMSPPRRRDKGEVIKGANSDVTSQEVPVVPGRKKKRAPLPPPGMSASFKINSNTDQTDQPKVSIHTHKNDEDEALKAMEEVTMKFNIEDDDDDMHMVENSSIHSEDIDLDMRRQRPPCNFIAPPPPTEPPPDDSEPVDMSMVVSQVDTIDIGVGEGTTSPGPDSNKSSPRSSNELKAEMSEFKDKISSLAAEDSTDAGALTGQSVQSNTSEEPGTENDVSKDTTSDTGSLANEEIEERKGTEGNRESSEITYGFTIDSVPPDFQGKEAEEEHHSEEEEIEFCEEITIYPNRPDNIEVMETSSPRRIPDLESPKEHKAISLPSKEVLSEMPVDKSTPLDSVQKEIIEEPKAPKIEEKEEFVISLDELSSIDFSVSKPGEKRDNANRSQSFDEGKMGYRIEFVKAEPIQTEDGVTVPNAMFITSDDDDNVDGSFEELEESFEVKNKCSELSFSPNGEGEVEHVMEEKSISMIALPAERTPVKSSTLNTDDSGISEPDQHTFASSTKIVLSQSPEGDRSSRETSPRSNLSSPRKEESSETQQTLLQAQYQQLQEQFTVWQNQLASNQKLLASQGHDSDISSNQMSGSDSQSNLQLQQLQLQMQMQQQMMLQLQQSMHALTLQQALAASQPVQPVQQKAQAPIQTNEQITPSVARSVQSEPARERLEDKRRARSPEQATSIVPKPPPPPVESAKPKVVKADAKYSKPKQKRFERQLDPREQLMLDIRNRGRGGLKKVPVKATHWHK